MGLPKKSLWKDRLDQRYSFVCRNCRTPRTLPFHPDIGGWRDHFRVGLTAATFTVATWPWIEWKGIVSYVPFWAAYEIWHRIRLRRRGPGPGGGGGSSSGQWSVPASPSIISSER